MTSSGFNDKLQEVLHLSDDKVFYFTVTYICENRVMIKFLLYSTGQSQFVNRVAQKSGWEIKYDFTCCGQKKSEKDNDEISEIKSYFFTLCQI